jgi:hypothetical protein
MIGATGSRPIVRKAKLQAKADDGQLQSELGKSLGDEDKPRTPPHLMSLPTQNFNGHDMCSRPVSPSHLSTPMATSVSPHVSSSHLSTHVATAVSPHGSVCGVAQQTLRQAEEAI